MIEIELKECDMNRMRTLNAKNEYSLNCSQMLKIINDHKRAKEAGNNYKCELIEFRLTDINFHREVAKLNTGKYAELKEEAKQW